MPRILKFDTDVGYDLLYCVKENQPLPTYYFLYPTGNPCFPFFVKNEGMMLF